MKLQLTKRDEKRIRRLAKKSAVSVEHWLRSVVLSAAAVDETHWREIEDIERAKRDIPRSEIVSLVKGHPMSVRNDDFLIEEIHERLARARVHGLIDGRRTGSKP